MTAVIPSATYRLQFHQHFKFTDAIKLIPYLNQLGITHCYASPVLTARPGSTHGYDIIDHNHLNPEIGTQEDFDELVETLHAHQMGLILDIVPNHMGIGEDNSWWMDVLEHGPSSRYATYFDIDWSPLKHELKGKVLLPILGNAYGLALEQGDLQVGFDSLSGSFKVHYHEHFLPVTPQSYPLILRNSLESFKKELMGDSDILSETELSTTEVSVFPMMFLEYESILRSFEQLPPHKEKDSERILERDREVKVAKHRLAQLCQQHPELELLIQQTLKAFNSVKYNRKNQALLHQLLEAQVYRLAYWRVAGEEINYRRFFDINELAGICVENQDVFRDTHAFIFKLIQQGKVNGLRLDHPDGLFDPAAYFKQLQSEINNLIDDPDKVENTEEDLPFYILAEKILALFEHLPGNWAIHGTTGYDFIAPVTGVFVQQSHQAYFTRLYERFSKLNETFSDILLACKRLTLKIAMASELNVLAHQLNRLSESDLRCRDFTLNGLRKALADVLAAFPVYRTYLDANGTSNKDKDYVEWAVRVAKKRTTGIDLEIYDFIQSLLLSDIRWIKPSAPLSDISADAVAELENVNSNENIEIIYDAFAAAMRRFAMKFQQLSGPVMAKSMEDTAFYRYNRLISLNEVGCQPDVFGISIAAFHHQNQERAKQWPHSMLASSTHDTKRSEDVRARLNVLSEMPRLWRYMLMKWSRINRVHKTLVDDDYYPSRNDEYLLYQTICGVFPLSIVDWSDPQIATDLTSRIKNAMQKAVREAKIFTSWMNPNEIYEKALFKFIDATLSSDASNLFKDEFLPFVSILAQAGNINTLSQLVLKLTSPGVPDIYQGMEVFSLDLVDPDNRRPVDYTYRSKLLQAVQPVLNADYETERVNLLVAKSSNFDNKDFIKIFVTCSTLAHRKVFYNVYTNGAYLPLSVQGNKSEQVIAYMRQYGKQKILVLVTRFWADAIQQSLPVNSISISSIQNYTWEDTSLDLSLDNSSLCNTKWKELYTARELKITNSIVSIKELLPVLPVAVWILQ